MYTKKEVEKYLNLSAPTIRKYIANHKLTISDDGLFDEEHIHAFKAAIPPTSMDTIKANESEMLRMVRHGVTLREIATKFNIPNWSVFTYFKGLSTKSPASEPPSQMSHLEYLPSVSYLCATKALNMAVHTQSSAQLTNYSLPAGGRC